MRLGQAALAVLHREGRKLEGSVAERGTWVSDRTLADGTNLGVRFTGAELPRTIPVERVAPSEIARNPDWTWTCRLTLTAPIVTLDLCWRPDSPLRIFVFSRGDWESALVALDPTRPDEA